MADTIEKVLEDQVNDPSRRLRPWDGRRWVCPKCGWEVYANRCADCGTPQRESE